MEINKSCASGIYDWRVQLDYENNNTCISNKKWFEIEVEHYLLLEQKLRGRDNKDINDGKEEVDQETVAGGSGVNNDGDRNNNNNEVHVQPVQVQVQVLQQKDVDNISNDDDDGEMIDVTEILLGMLGIEMDCYSIRWRQWL